MNKRHIPSEQLLTDCNIELDCCEAEKLGGPMQYSQIELDYSNSLPTPPWNKFRHGLEQLFVGVPQTVLILSD